MDTDWELLCPLGARERLEVSTGGAGLGSFSCSALGYTEQHPPYIPHPNQGLKPCSRSLKAKLFGK